jgi:integrase
MDMALTEIQCKNAKPKPNGKSHVLSDGEGLLLDIRPSGKKYFILRMWRSGKEIRRSLGSYPELSLKEARQRAREMKEQDAPPDREDNFGKIADEWISRRVDNVLADSYARVIHLRMDRYILPKLGKLPLKKITSGTILKICREIEDTGNIETAHRVRQLIGQVFRYAIAIGIADTDPTVALHGALIPSRPKHYATITDTEGIKTLVQSIDKYPYVLMKSALWFSVLTFCRPGEVRHAEWSEISLDDALWRIPPEKMKTKSPHIVPLCTQLVSILRELQEITGGEKYLFPSPRGGGRPLSENGVRVALRSMGFGPETITAHGFRSMASTALNENGFAPDIIEKQLAHTERNSVRAAYNHAEYMPQRREMMQWWGNYLFTLLSRA